MAVHMNGTRAADPEAEAAGYTSLEDEWQELGLGESHESSPYASQEDEWGMPEVAYANTEGEWQESGLGEMPEWSPYANQEDEWGELGLGEIPELSPYASQEDEGADQFLPLLPLLAAKALPLIGKVALPAIKRLLPIAKRAVGGVVQNLLAGGGGGGGPAPAPVNVRRPSAPRPRPTRPSGGPGGGPATPRSAMVAGLFRQLADVLAQGEREASALEAQFFGANEFQGELAGLEQAHEAALTEVLAAESAHAETESEAAALLGSSLPITIRIMGGVRPLRPVMPALVQANARLVRGLRRGGPAGAQLLRLGPPIHRRTIASLRAIRRSGRPVTPGLVHRVMAAQAARVLGSPRIAGRALIRNTAIRRGTVAPARPYGRRRRAYAY